jgi:hypothetical protein
MATSEPTAGMTVKFPDMPAVNGPREASIDPSITTLPRGIREPGLLPQLLQASRDHGQE